ncbi:MAG: rbr [Paenibacillaceae bacterium]|jgi:rubrerythrin|nr:rbr [Paenibacillaceae bacterium]
MKSLVGTRTAENLLAAFAGEAQASMRYAIFALVAKEEGLLPIANIFEETSHNEKEHAKRFYNLLVEGFAGELPSALEIKASYPFAKGTTADNLRAAASGENEEWTELYPEFARIATEEGFPQVAGAFRLIMAIEKRHEARYLKLAGEVDSNQVFQKEEKVVWICTECGHIHEGKNPPEKCPTCLKAKQFFELFTENFSIA